jgi:hypothetical protein
MADERAHTALLVELVCQAGSRARLNELKGQAGSHTRLILKQPDVVAPANSRGGAANSIAICALLEPGAGATNPYPPGRV